MIMTVQSTVERESCTEQNKGRVYLSVCVVVLPAENCRAVFFFFKLSLLLRSISVLLPGYRIRPADVGFP